MVNSNNDIYYPKNTTDGVSSILYHDNTTTSISYCQSNYVNQYAMNGAAPNPNYNSDSEILRLVDEVNTYQVTTSDSFSLQYSEGTCDFTTADNSGVSCAEVYFMYYDDVVLPPSKDPTYDPTIDPTTDPTSDPTQSPTIAEEEALEVCFDSTSHSTGYEFSPPFDGEIIGITLVHTSGDVSCRLPLDDTGSNWGCAQQEMMVVVVDSNNDVYYPKDTTQGITSISYYDSTTTSVSYCQSGYPSIYSMQGTYDAFSSTLEFIDEDNTYSVTTSDIFSLQYSEGTCGFTISDNSGISCAEVYFIYKPENDDPPTAKDSGSKKDESSLLSNDSLAMKLLIELVFGIVIISAMMI
mmetsp:Transcript_74446/g.66974  ORF Transcript_74446/g.66974 Transcript_74446/m.66974 type:complete len:352 (+) Transcript_74446:3-1058(+)